MSEEACNKVWQYNSNVQAVQNKLGEGYYVSKIFFFREKQTNKLLPWQFGLNISP